MINYKRNKVVVIGDIILDKYVDGIVTRISPEAPVPVIKIKNEYQVLGGASNVANNLAALGCKVGIVGTLGNDESGNEIISLLKENKIDTSAVNLSCECRTIVKKRVVASKQQIARLDYNDDAKPSTGDILVMLESFKDIVDNYEVVVISDYNKGVCTFELCSEIVKICSQKNKIVIVDPKGPNWMRYKGATVVTPNIKEISEFLKVEVENSNTEIEEKCKGVCNKLGADYLLLTRSEKGMTLIDKENNFEHITSKAKEVFDVSGAGDTVVASLSCFIGKTESILKAVNIANIAAGIAVSKFGTATVTLDEIDEVLIYEKGDQVKNKILNLRQLMQKVEKWKSNKESIVFTNGCFDILHKGHVHSVYSAAEFGDHLIVAINSDSSVRKNKGNDRPINKEYDRAYVIASMGCVDAVIIFEEDTPEKLLSNIRPNILVKGGDYSIEEVIGGEFAERVELISYIDGYSTTRMINKMNERVG